MPELPEVTTTVNGIEKECSGWTITDVWTDLAVTKPSRIDFYETIKYLPYFKNFSKNIKDTKILDAKRRGKNILINLNNKKTILVHMKMTGHMMVGLYDYDKKQNKWAVHKDEKNTALHDPYNRFIHVVFTLSKNNQGANIRSKARTRERNDNSYDNIKHLVLCDARKFAKVVLIENEIHHTKHLGTHGPEPINPNILYADFIKAIDTAPANSRPIKILLMDTRTISGIGNIYSDEMLFLSGIHPESKWVKIPIPQKKLLHKNMLAVLQKGIDFGGDSMSDYRNIYGRRGEFQNNHNAYRKTGEKCGKKNCTGTITRKVITGRSSHYCPVHQILFK